MGVVAKAVLVNKLLHGLWRIKCKRKRVAAHFEFDVRIVERINARKFLVRLLNALNVIFIRNQLKFIKVTQLLCGKLSTLLHPLQCIVIQQI